ncbi:hypothetical protein cyc_03733 [Cyclospora cayetanensis]|uniref:Uncharacterized protein n=1 Tax=Cyclospora cayetanensis TaxID=88456 RepID=A0A1D3D902_9EIME|nr:hypothetical protein cyc_03733 [Cyclospora cayetanensis]
MPSERWVVPLPVAGSICSSSGGRNIDSCVEGVQCDSCCPCTSWEVFSTLWLPDKQEPLMSSAERPADTPEAPASSAGPLAEAYAFRKRDVNSCSPECGSNWATPPLECAPLKCLVPVGYTLHALHSSVREFEAVSQELPATAVSLLELRANPHQNPPQELTELSVPLQLFSCSRSGSKNPFTPCYAECTIEWQEAPAVQHVLSLPLASPFWVYPQHHSALAALQPETQFLIARLSETEHKDQHSEGRLLLLSPLTDPDACSYAALQRRSCSSSSLAGAAASDVFELQVHLERGLPQDKPAKLLLCVSAAEGVSLQEVASLGLFGWLILDDGWQQTRPFTPQRMARMQSGAAAA